MDLISTRAIDITKLALDGLMTRQKAVTANTANIMTPGYVRKEVSFENQLKEIVEKDDLKTYIKEQNSIKYSPASIEEVTGSNRPQSLTIQKANYLQSNIYSKFEPQIMDDVLSGATEDGNNVVLEKEMMDMAKVGTQYTILAALQQKAFKGILDAIKGQ